MSQHLNANQFMTIKLTSSQIFHQKTDQTYFCQKTDEQLS